MWRITLLFVVLAGCSQPTDFTPESPPAFCDLHSEPIVFGHEPDSEPQGFGCLTGVTKAELERSMAWESVYRAAHSTDYPNSRATRKSVRSGQVLVRQCLTCSEAERQWLSDHPRDA